MYSSLNLNGSVIIVTLTKYLSDKNLDYLKSKSSLSPFHISVPRERVKLDLSM